MNDFEKFKIRGAIKEIMRNYGLRTISLSNYFKYLGNKPTSKIHTIRYNIMNDYIQSYGYRNNGLCGEAFETIGLEEYKNIFEIITEILDSIKTIPYKNRRNILVPINR